MDRRTFFGTLVAAIAARKIPVELEPIKLAQVFPSVTGRFSSYSYGLGFKITRELLDDDLYGQSIGEMISQTAKEIDDEILRRG